MAIARLLEFISQRELGGGIHTTYGPFLAEPSTFSITDY